jgi:hypothetical protein
MVLKVYLFKDEKIMPIVLLASNTNSNEEMKIYEKYYLNFYEILFSKDIIDDKTILVFCNFNKDNLKKQLQVQGSINCDKDILKDLESNIKNIEYVASKVLNDYSANILLELDETVKIKSTNTKLDLMLKLFN